MRTKQLSRAALLAAAIALAAAGTAHAAGVVISQVYGGGGNSGAPLHNDFIELFNGGTDAQSLSGWSVQYASSGGGTWNNATPLPDVTLNTAQRPDWAASTMASNACCWAGERGCAAAVGVVDVAGVVMGALGAERRNERAGM